MGKRTTQLELAVARYVDLLSVTRRPNTVQRYRFALRLFIRYLKHEHPGISSFSKLRRIHVERWLRLLATRTCRTGRPLQNGSRRIRIIMVRRFLDDISAWNWRCAPTIALFKRGDTPPEDRLLPKPVPRDSDRKLQKVLRNQGGLLPNALLFLRSTGLRCQELLDLKTDSLEKICENRWALRVPLGKLHSQRLVPVDEKTAKLFGKLLRLRGNPPPVPDPITGRPVEFLLVHKDGKPWSRWSLRRILNCAVDQACIRDVVTPHRLRHTYATEMMRAGISLPVLMHILGHRTIRMTMRYVQITQEDVQRSYGKAMATIANRYSLPVVSLPDDSNQAAPPRENFLGLLKTAATLLEAVRRDEAEGPLRKKALQRLVERIRRLGRDFTELWA
jgi:site-specific recombinase XerD